MRDMRLNFHERFILRQRFLFVAGLLLCFYFSYHLLQGERSYARLVGVTAATIREEVYLADLRAQNKMWESRVKMLRPGSINRDYLEERARDMLGYRSGQEVDVIRP